MRYPFWSSLIQKLSRPSATLKEFEAAAELANHPEHCLIGEAVGFGHRFYDQILTPEAREIFYRFNMRIFQNYPNLDSAKTLLARAKRLRKVLK